MLDDMTTESNDKTVHSVAHGVVRLEELAPDYGPERRRMRVIKYRGRRFRGGFLDLSIDTGGVKIFPRLISGEHHKHFERKVLPTASPELNALLGGGVEHGLVGDMKTPVDVNYIADTVILLRYFEAVGQVRRAILVVKKRMSAHENSMRNYRINRAGVWRSDRPSRIFKAC